ncbi:MurR/RpiR family transcriptional regulator [Propionicicella superfundia]|uniref:MurR/RpiR family transcriptional regulator n=1 Tax=Propionicicella superfundia TaxID=348582 RepID=UPI0004296758|nr:MurR/RpiR family transcriptional regulator [Propionicicella superfundia]
MTLAETLRGDLSALTPRERKVAWALIAEYPGAGLGSAADLAKAAGVSAPTVVRFARALGFGGFADLQTQLREELTQRTLSPFAMLAEQLQRNDTSPEHWLARGLPAQQECLRALGGIPVSELDRAAGLLADPRLRVTAFGGRYSGLIAHYLTLHLQQVRPGVRPQAPGQALPGSEFLDTDKRDVFVVYDFRRYQTSTIRQAEALAAAGASLICITDPWLSPVAKVSEVVLPTSVASATPFDSSAAAFVLTELLVGAVLDLVGDSALERIRRWDEVRADEVEAWQAPPDTV